MKQINFTTTDYDFLFFRFPFSAFMNMKKRKGIDFGKKKKIFSKAVFLHVSEVPEHVSVDFRGGHC